MPVVVLPKRQNIIRRLKWIQKKSMSFQRFILLNTATLMAKMMSASIKEIEKYFPFEFETDNKGDKNEIF